MERKHTPGPWRARANTRGGKPTGSYYVETNSDGFATSVVCENVSECDASLLAAAPQLLQALEELVPPMPPADASCHLGIRDQEQCLHCSRIRKAHAAIAAAKAA